MNYQEEREVFEEAKQITINICEELLKCVDKLRPKSPIQNAHPQAQSPAVTSGININPSNIEPTITRIELFLEDGEWDNVIQYSNAALDYFPTDYRLYLYLLLGELKATSVDELEKCDTPFTDSSSYKKLKRFADPDLIRKLESYSADAAGKREEVQRAQQEAEKQKEAEEQQRKAQQEEQKAKALEAAILGVYEGTNFITPSWTAYNDHVTYKNKDFYFKDMQSFKITKVPDSSLSAGQIMIYMKNKKMQFIAFKYVDCERAMAFTQYVNNKILLAPLEEAREKLAQEASVTTEKQEQSGSYLEQQTPVDEVWE